MIRSVRLRISGRVQGVGYRAWFAERAQRAGLHGMVRNNADGSVEAVVSGPPDLVAALIAACHDGPPAAAVRAVVVSDADPPPPGFRVAPSA